MRLQTEAQLNRGLIGLSLATALIVSLILWAVTR